MRTLLIILASFTLNYLSAQYTDTVYVGFEKTAYLIFDGPVKCDKGSEYIHVKYPENKVIIQALEEEFEETSLLVQCSNEYFLFLVRYDVNPKRLFYNYQKSARGIFISKDSTLQDRKLVSPKPKSIMQDFAMVEKEEKIQATQDSIKTHYDSICEKVIDQKPRIYNRGAILGKVTFQVTNICQTNDQFYFKMKVTNNSKISYDMDFIGWVVRDVKRKVIKGVSDQPIQLNPIYTYEQPQSIGGKESVEIVYVFDKIVIGKDKKLNIEAWEDNTGLKGIEGGRKMEFSIFSDDIMDITIL